MPPSYVVQADVVDIRVDKPKSTDALLVDTQVWLWMTYAHASAGANPPWPNQLTDYPGYLKKALAIRPKLFRCGLSLAELAHRVEKTEHEIFEKAKSPIKPKEFRHNQPTERANVVAQVQSAWSVVKAMSLPLDVAVDDLTTDAALTRFQTQPLDGYDLFILEAMNKAGIVQILSDDRDFCTVSGIQLFTANANVVAAARAQNKLVTR